MSPKCRIFKSGSVGNYGRYMYHLDQLTAFVTAAESGSFSAAARKIGKGHSTVSAAINNLEISINAQLFDRSQKYPVLTPVGEQIYAQAKLMLRQHERMLGFANSKANFEEESLAIGIGALLPFGYIEEELEKMSSSYPHTNIRLVRGVSTELQEQALAGKLDLVLQINRGAVPASFDFIDLIPLEWDCVCSPDSELADMEIVTSEAMLVTRQIQCTAAVENPLTQVASQFSNEVWEANHQDDVVNMVEQDLGWAFLPRSLTKERIANGTLKTFYPDYNPDKLPATTMVDLLLCPGKQCGPALQLFITLLREKSMSNHSR